MKAIVVRSKVTRKVLRGAIFVGRDRVIPFAARMYKNSVLSHETFKSDNLHHYILAGYASEDLSDWKAESRKRYGDGIFFQEVISNG